MYYFTLDKDKYTIKHDKTLSGRISSWHDKVTGELLYTESNFTYYKRWITSYSYYKNNLLHNEVGPAMSNFDSMFYYFEGKQLQHIKSTEELISYLKETNNGKDIPDKQYNIYSYDDSIRYYCVKIKFLHRTNGPAVIFKDGRKEYWFNGKYLDFIKSDKEIIKYSELQVFS